jgi:hypothetical protein
LNIKPKTEESSKLPQQAVKTIPAPSVPVVQPSTSAPPQAKPAEVPLHVSIERAIQLPLVVDPLSMTMSSPFVDEGESQLASPNPFVTFSWTSKETLPSKDKKSVSILYRTHIVPYQTSPSWNFHSTAYLHRTLEALRHLKCVQGAVEFTVWHSPNLKKAVGLLSSALPPPAGVADVDLSTCEKLGIANVDISPLFAGSKNVHGWYPVMNGSSQKGQLLVKIEPAENLASVIMDLTGPASIMGITDASFSKEKSNASSDILLPLPSKSGDNSASFSGAPPMAIALANKSGSEADVSRSSLFAAAITAAKEATTGQNVDTWVWTGSGWDHRKIEVQALNEGDTSVGNLKNILAGLHDEDQPDGRKDAEISSVPKEESEPKATGKTSASNEAMVTAIRLPTPALAMSPARPATDPGLPSSLKPVSSDPSEEFRRSLQRTINELHTLQNIISTGQLGASTGSKSSPKMSANPPPTSNVVTHIKTLEETLQNMSLGSLAKDVLNASEKLPFSNQATRGHSPDVMLRPFMTDGFLDSMNETKRGGSRPSTPIGLALSMSPPRPQSRLSASASKRELGENFVSLSNDSGTSGGEDHIIRLANPIESLLDTSVAEVCIYPRTCNHHLALIIWNYKAISTDKIGPGRSIPALSCIIAHKKFITEAERSPSIIIT